MDQRAKNIEEEQAKTDPARTAEAASWTKALKESPLEQVRLIDVLDRVLFLPDRDRKRREADGAAAELLADGAQDLTVEAIEALVVDLEQIESGSGDRLVYDATLPNLGVVAYALEQAVGDAGSAAAALRDRDRASVVDCHREQLRRPPDDLGELLGGVMLEPVLDSEAVTILAPAP